MLYRSTVHTVVFVEKLGRDVTLDPAVELDDQLHDDAIVIAQWAPRGLLRASNVEQATAAPGETRTTRRTRAAE